MNGPCRGALPLVLYELNLFVDLDPGTRKFLIHCIVFGLNFFFHLGPKAGPVRVALCGFKNSSSLAILYVLERDCAPLNVLCRVLALRVVLKVQAPLTLVQRVLAQLSVV